MAKNQTKRRNNSNPFVDLALERPVVTAAAAAGAVATGVFLWSKRTQISDQLSQLSEQIGEWADTMGRSGQELETVGGDSSFRGTNTGSTKRSSPGGRRSTGSRSKMSPGDASVNAGDGESTAA